MPGDSSSQILSGLPVVDRFLPLWIFAAMGLGVVIGYAVPQTGPLVNSLQVGPVSLPIAVGLFWIMYPPLAAVNYRKIGKVKTAGKMVGTSMLLNWVVGPVLMFTLAWILLPDLPLFRDGVILIGLARCIAMVLMWNMLAGGDREYAAIIVALNAAFQIAFYSVLGYLFLSVLPAWLAPATSATAIAVNPWDIAFIVAVFLGIPLATGMGTRYALAGRKGERWYEERFLAKLKPTSLLGLLFVLVVMFSLRGGQFFQFPLDLIRVSIPLVAYFSIMFMLAFFLSWKLGFAYKDTVTVSFSAASNDFELAIATAVGVFGLSSNQAFAAVVGPLIEVPVMLGLVYLALWMRPRLFTVAMSKMGAIPSVLPERVPGIRKP
jgi:ACR3 family arsenite transporter